MQKKKCFTSFMILISIFSFTFLFKENFSLFNSLIYSVPLNKLSEKEFHLRLKGPIDWKEMTLLKYLRNRHLTPPSLKTYHLNNFPNHNHSSWNFVDKIVRRLFKDVEKGFFVEAGAMDGEFISNTLWMEIVGKWEGLLVEPDPTNYKHLLSKNRKVWSSHSCLSKYSYPSVAVFNSPEFNVEGVPRGNSTIILNPIKSGTFNVDGGYEGENPERFFHHYFPMQCFPLQSLLYALNISTVDFLSLDIQGGEPELLENFPFQEIRIRAMVVELVEEIEGGEKSAEKFMKTRKFIRFMREKGYKLVAMSSVPDYFFILNDEFGELYSSAKEVDWETQIVGID